MKKLFCLIAVLAVLAIPASAFGIKSHADMYPGLGQFGKNYIGLGFSFLNVDYADEKVGMYDDIRSYGKLARFGRYLKPKIALEARYTSAWAEESASDASGGSKREFDFRIITGLIKADLFRIKEAQAYALLGWSNVHLKTLGTSDSYNGITYGFGVEAPFHYDWPISYTMEYNHIVNEELLNVCALNVLFNWRF